VICWEIIVEKHQRELECEESRQREKIEGQKMIFE